MFIYSPHRVSALAFAVLKGNPMPEDLRGIHVAFDAETMPCVYRAIQDAQMENHNMAGCALVLGVRAYWSLRAEQAVREMGPHRRPPDSVRFYATPGERGFLFMDLPVYLDARAWPDTNVALVGGPETMPR